MADRPDEHTRHLVLVGEGAIVIDDGFAVIGRADLLFAFVVIEVFGTRRPDRSVPAIVERGQHDALRREVCLVIERIVLAGSREEGVPLGISHGTCRKSGHPEPEVLLELDLGIDGRGIVNLVARNHLRIGVRVKLARRIGGQRAAEHRVRGRRRIALRIDGREGHWVGGHG